MNGPYDPEYEFNLEEASTSCEVRAYNSYLGYSDEHNQLWGASYGWLNAVIKGCHKIQKQENIEKINVPILMFQAGRDTLVHNDGQNQLSVYAKDISVYTVKNSKHEIWNEKNEILIPYYNTIFETIENFIA